MVILQTGSIIWQGWVEDIAMLKESRSYSLKKSLKKVHRCLPAVDGSILLLFQTAPGKDVLMHVDINGESVFTENFQDMVDTLTMPTDRHCIILLVPKDKIFLLDLRSHKKQLFNFQYQIDISCQVKLEFFSRTKLLAVIENGAYNHPFLKISYLQFPIKAVGKNGELIPCATFQSQEGDWTYEYTIRKGNSHSMLIWYRSRHDEEFQLRTFDLRGDAKKGGYRVLRIKNTLGDPYGIDRINCALQEVWEMRPSCFCLVATTDKTEKKCVNLRQNIINNFIWDVDKAIIREVAFELPPKANQLQIDAYSSGKYSMFRSFDFSQGKSVDSPAIFVSNHSEQIVANQSSKFSYQSNWQVPPYSDCQFAEGLYDNSGVTELTMVIRLILTRKVKCLYILAESGCLDVELMKDVVVLLDPQQS